MFYEFRVESLAFTPLQILSIFFQNRFVTGFRGKLKIGVEEGRRAKG